MTEDVRNQVVNYLWRNKDIFAWTPQDLEGIDPGVITHHLNLDPSVRPIKQKKLHFGPEKDKIIEGEVKKLLSAGHIKEIQFPKWLSNIILVPKLGGKWKMCIDFPDLNKACPKNFYPLPRIDQLVDSTSGCELLSMVDALQGYHQRMLAPENHKRVSFITSDDTFCYVAIPFRLKNIGATYQSAKEISTKTQPWKMSVWGHWRTFPGIYGDPTSRYLATLFTFISTSQAVSSVLVQEEDSAQTPIYYVSKVLNGAEYRYLSIEKTVLALVITARKLCPYFISYPVWVRTNTPIKQVLSKSEAFTRLVKWAIELSEYDILHLPRTTIKTQALPDFVFEKMGTTQREVLKERLWLLHVDGSSTTQEIGAGVVITSSQGRTWNLR
ncbi:UNVERIFIED_CONTAM: Retrovirus-related Pol polyprotein from transposon [Sesamum calycinum]|uniref:Retrovirus-related Pol polyprotein from transposon n=1 Tax=Sesamum calycinum TaxID=2727403 RepID=A0AAW2M8Y5_9LAMI